jgi:aspartate carbamoyltransferase catalytic subunit
MARVFRENSFISETSNGCDLKESLLYAKDIISIKDLNLTQIQQICDIAEAIKNNLITPNIKNKIIAHCFFEPSTRTRLSFETATLRLEGQVIGFSSDASLSMKKGETLHDTMKMIDHYADLIIIRHQQDGTARFAADICEKPVINAGDGANQHPTQALTDLFTIKHCQAKLEGLSIALVGDLKYGRTVHSLVEILSHFRVRLFLVTPNVLHLPEGILNNLKQAGIRFSCHQSLHEVINKIDVLYMTRIQRERLQATESTLDETLILTPKLLEQAKPNLKILHPLPRLNEIDKEVDQTPYAHYFVQANNALYVRQALLSLILNKVI